MVYYATASLLALGAGSGASGPNFVMPDRQSRQRASPACWAREIGTADRRVSCWRSNANRTIPDYLRRAASGGRGRRVRRRWPRPWTSAIRATWSDCGICFRSLRIFAAQWPPIPCTTPRSVPRLPRTTSGSAMCGARTRPRDFTSTTTCRERSAATSRGSSRPRRIRPNSRRSWKPAIGTAVEVPEALAALPAAAFERGLGRRELGRFAHGDGRVVKFYKTIN